MLVARLSADLPLLLPASDATPSAATWESSLNLQKNPNIRTASAKVSLSAINSAIVSTPAYASSSANASAPANTSGP